MSQFGLTFFRTVQFHRSHFVYRLGHVYAAGSASSLSNFKVLAAKMSAQEPRDRGCVECSARTIVISVIQDFARGYHEVIEADIMGDYTVRGVSFFTSRRTWQTQS